MWGSAGWFFFWFSVELEFGRLGEEGLGVVEEDLFGLLVGVSASAHLEDGLVEGSGVGGAPVSGGVDHDVVGAEFLDGVDDSGG